MASCYMELARLVVLELGVTITHGTGLRAVGARVVPTSVMILNKMKMR